MFQETDFTKPTWASSFRLLTQQTKRIQPIDTKLNIDIITPQNINTMTMLDQDLSTPSLSSQSSFSSYSSSALLEDEMSLDQNEQISQELVHVKSQTCPEMSLIASISTPSLELCSEFTLFKQKAAIKVTRAATKGKTQLKRAATWLGLANQKILKKQQLEKSLQWQLSKDFVYGTSIDHINFIKQQIERNAQTIAAPKRVMSCKVEKIINLASSRECDYELQVQLNDTNLSTMRGTLRKHEKDVSKDVPYTEPFIFEIEEPFSLNFVVAARHKNTLVREGLSRLGIWPLHQQSNSDESSQLPVVGHSCLNFENKMDVLEHGVSRLKLTRSNNKFASRGMNIELVVDIEVKDIEKMTLFDSQDIVDSIKHCQGGDYLTIYTKTSTLAVWKRYWVVLKYDQLVFYDFCFKESKEPLVFVSLATLKTIGKPSMDDCELLGISRNRGVAFDFDTINLPDDAAGKMFVYADTECNAAQWQRGLTAHIKQQKNRHNNGHHSLDSRFIW